MSDPQQGDRRGAPADAERPDRAALEHKNRDSTSEGGRGEATTGPPSLPGCRTARGNARTPRPSQPGAVILPVYAMTIGDADSVTWRACHGLAAELVGLRSSTLPPLRARERIVALAADLVSHDVVRSPAYVVRWDGPRVLWEAILGLSPELHRLARARSVGSVTLALHRLADLAHDTLIDRLLDEPA